MPQSSRRPGGGAGSLRPTLDSERSPSVHYANWKETMLLGRQLTTLARTEKALVHGITADQKVAFRRFQSKLQRSKITNARMWSDKEEEIELRDAGMRRLHSESHLLDDGKIDFLSKLEKRPYTAEIGGQKDNKTKSKHKKSSAAFLTRQNTRSLTAPAIAIHKIKTSGENPSTHETFGQNSDKTVNHENCKPKSNSTSKALLVAAKPLPAESVSKVVGTATKTAENDGGESQELTSSSLGESISATTDNEIERGEEKNIKDSSACVAENPVPIKNCRNRLRPGQSTFPLQTPENHDDKEAAPSVDEKSKEEPNTEVTTDRNNVSESISDSPVQPRNPRNRIRPGQSSFLTTNKPAVSTEKPTLSETPSTSEISPAAQNDSKSKNQSSFIKACLEESKLHDKSTKTKHKGKAELNSDPCVLTNVKGPKQNNMNRAKRRSIQLRGSVPGRPSLFTELQRPDFCQMRLDAVKSVEFETKVRSFCEGIEELGESAAHCDYYASKMQDMVAGQKKISPPTASLYSEHCEVDYRRHMGNTAMPCITLKKVRLDGAEDDTAGYSLFAEDLDCVNFKPLYHSNAAEELSDNE